MKRDPVTAGRAAETPAVALAVVLARGLVILQVAAAVLLVAPQHFAFPYITPKVLTFRVIGLGLAALATGLAIARPARFLPRPTMVSAAIAGLLLAASVSTVAGVDSHRSFWDTGDRMLGLYTLLHVGLVFVVARGVFDSGKSWRVLWSCVLGIGAIATSTAVLQRTIDGFLPPDDPTRPGGTLGHPAYLGSAGGFAVWIGFWMFCENRDRISRFVGLGGGLLGLLAIGLSQTRGSVFGLACGISVAVAVHFFTSSRSPQRVGGIRARRLFVAVAAVVSWVAVMALGVLLVRSTPETFSDVPVVGRFADLVREGGTLRTRTLAWKIAVEAGSDRPWFGWGLNNFAAGFDRYYEPEFLDSGMHETWWDDAHNVYLNSFAEQGIAGLFARLAFVVLPLLALVRGWRSGCIQRHLAVAGAGLMTGEAVHEAAVFECLASFVLMALFLAFIDRQLERGGSAEDFAPSSSRRQRAGALAGSGVIVLALPLMLIEWSIARVSHGSLDAGSLAARGDPAAVEMLEELIAIGSPHTRQAIQLMAAQAVNRHALGSPASTPAESKLFVSLYEALGSSTAPSVRTTVSRAKLALILFSRFRDGRYIQAAAAEVRGALEISPRRQELYFLLADLERCLGRGSEAIALLARAVNLRPTVAESWSRFAFTLAQLGDRAHAIETVQKARERGVIFTGRDLSRLRGIDPELGGTP